MIRLFQAVCLAGAAVAFAACSESGPTTPDAATGGSAARDVVGFAAPGPSASCTVVQVATGYAATATWSGISAIAVKFFNGTQLVGQTVFSHPLRSGSVTDTVQTAPTTAEVDGKTLGAKILCSTGA